MKRPIPARNAILTNVLESPNDVQIADCVERPLLLGKKSRLSINQTDRIRRNLNPNLNLIMIQEIRHSQQLVLGSLYVYMGASCLYIWRIPYVVVV